MSADLSDERLAIGTTVHLARVPSEPGLLSVRCCACGEEIMLLGEGDNLDVIDHLEAHAADWCKEGR